MKWVLHAALLFYLWTPCFGIQGEVKHIHPRDYFATLTQEIEQAKESIIVYLYHFSINPDNSNSLPLKIAEALIQAKKRGVLVEVVLDQNIDFTAHPSKDAWVVDGKNWTAYEFLSANKIPVYFDSPSTYIHSKVAVFDKETVILGSSNWSQTSLTKNVETNVLLRSKTVAEEILNYLSTVERQTPLEEGPTVPIPFSFMENSQLLGKMVISQDNGGFDLYTALLKMAWEKGTTEFNLNEEELGTLLGLKGKKSIGYQRGLAKAYRRLEKKYNLIHYENSYGKEIHVQLINLPNPDKILSVPLNYWTLGWNKKLALPGKLFYFISLYQTSISDRKPQWSLAEATLAANFHVSPQSISIGVTKLRRANLIEVMYDTLTKEAAPRRANIYVTNSLYDPLLIEKGLKQLQEKYGADLLDQAQKCATLVYEDSSLKTIETFIQLEQTYGREKIIIVYNKLKLKSPDNPKRSPGYFINTVKSLGSDFIQEPAH